MARLQLLHLLHQRSYHSLLTTHPSYILHAGVGGAREPDPVEYDLDNEDEDWLKQYNLGRNKLNDVLFEKMLWKLELACAEATDSALTAAGQWAHTLYECFEVWDLYDAGYGNRVQCATARGQPRHGFMKSFAGSACCCTDGDPMPIASPASEPWQHACQVLSV